MTTICSGHPWCKKCIDGIAAADRQAGGETGERGVKFESAL